MRWWIDPAKLVWTIAAILLTVGVLPFNHATVGILLIASLFELKFRL